MLDVRNVTKVYRQGRRWVRALAGVSLHFARGEFVAVVGRSGSGKSTLLHLLGGLDEPTSGRVLFDGRDLRRLSDRQRALLRRSRIGFVFQLFNLLPTLSAAENVALPLLLAGESAGPCRQRARAALERVGLAERAGHFPEEMSGGEMQRVAIARALVTEPEVVLCDEPTGSLDSATGRAVLDLLRGLAEAGRRSVVLVTHDPDAADRADRVIHLEDGRVQEAAEHRGQDVHALSHA
jgi:putative ABC transport system ATP-binding protein